MWINGWNTSIRSRVIISTWNETVLDNAIPDMEYEITILSCYESEVIFFFWLSRSSRGLFTDFSDLIMVFDTAEPDIFLYYFTNIFYISCEIGKSVYSTVSSKWIEKRHIEREWPSINHFQTLATVSLHMLRMRLIYMKSIGNSMRLN